MLGVLLDRRMPRRNRCAPDRPEVYSIALLDVSATPPVPFPRMQRALRKNATAGPPVLVVISTVGTEEQALDIAHELVGKHLAACVNIVPRIRSVFFWKGKVNDDGEWMLLVKTAPGNFQKVKDAIRRLNAYELPEILGFGADAADPLFAKWVVDSSTPRTPAARRKKTRPKKRR
jgi:periplasmic divalent cation tolerance protein